MTASLWTSKLWDISTTGTCQHNSKEWFMWETERWWYSHIFWKFNNFEKRFFGLIYFTYILHWCLWNISCQTYPYFKSPEKNPTVQILLLCSLTGQNKHYLCSRTNLILLYIFTLLPLVEMCEFFRLCFLSLEFYFQLWNQFKEFRIILLSPNTPIRSLVTGRMSLIWWTEIKHFPLSIPQRSNIIIKMYMCIVLFFVEERAIFPSKRPYRSWRRSCATLKRGRCTTSKSSTRTRMGDFRPASSKRSRPKYSKRE